VEQLGHGRLRPARQRETGGGGFGEHFGGDPRGAGGGGGDQSPQPGSSPRDCPRPRRIIAGSISILPGSLARRGVVRGGPYGGGGGVCGRSDWLRGTGIGRDVVDRAVIWARGRIGRSRTAFDSRIGAASFGRGERRGNLRGTDTGAGCRHGRPERVERRGPGDCRRTGRRVRHTQRKRLGNFRGDGRKIRRAREGRKSLPRPAAARQGGPGAGARRSGPGAVSGGGPQGDSAGALPQAGQSVPIPARSGDHRSA
jgi:hypothetical protein